MLAREHLPVGNDFMKGVKRHVAALVLDFPDAELILCGKKVCGTLFCEVYYVPKEW